MKPRLRRALWAVAVVVGLPIALHFGILLTTTMRPPPVRASAALADATVVTATDDPTRTTFGASYARKRGTINEARLVGSPADIGIANIELLRDQQMAIESHMHDQFAHYVPMAPARTLIVDLARLRFRNLDENLSPPHLEEIAAQAATFAPDPFTDLMGTYQRFVFLHSLYDIMLSFERSPLVGCTSFVLDGASERQPMVTRSVGRNFDFEGPRGVGPAQSGVPSARGRAESPTRR